MEIMIRMGGLSQHMALVPCLECGHEISDKAKACPKCGIPLNVSQNLNSNLTKDQTSSKSTAEIVTTILMVIGWFFPLIMLGGLVGGVVIWAKGYDNGTTFLAIIITDLVALWVWLNL